jgi:hypothetical protein
MRRRNNIRVGSGEMKPARAIKKHKDRGNDRKIFAIAFVIMVFIFSLWFIINPERRFGHMVATNCHNGTAMLFENYSAVQQEYCDQVMWVWNK